MCEGSTRGGDLVLDLDGEVAAAAGLTKLDSTLALNSVQAEGLAAGLVNDEDLGVAGWLRTLPCLADLAAGERSLK